MCLFPFTSDNFVHFPSFNFPVPKTDFHGHWSTRTCCLKTCSPFHIRRQHFLSRLSVIALKMATFLELGTYLPCSVTHRTTEIRAPLSSAALSVRFAMVRFLWHDMWSLHIQVGSCEGQVHVQDSSCQTVLLQNAPLANCVSWPTLQFLTTNLHFIDPKLNAWLPLSPYFPLHLFTSFGFNNLCHYSLFINLLLFIIGVTPVGRLHSITLAFYFSWDCHFWYTPFWFMPSYHKSNYGA